MDRLSIAPGGRPPRMIDLSKLTSPAWGGLITLTLLTGCTSDTDQDLKATSGNAVRDPVSVAEPSLPSRDIEELIESLSSDDELVRHEAIDELRRIGLIPAHFGSRLAPLLANADQGVARFVVESLGQMDSGVVTLVMPYLTHSLADVRQRAAEVMGLIGHGAEPVIPALVEVLSQDPAWSVREQSAQALGVMGRPAIHRLGEVLRSGDRQARQAAALAMEAAGAEAKIALPLLVQALLDKDAGVRSNIAVVLGNIGPEARIAVPLLRKLLDDENVDVRLEAAYALGQIELVPAASPTRE